MFNALPFLYLYLDSLLSSLFFFQLILRGLPSEVFTLNHQTKEDLHIFLSKCVAFLSFLLDHKMHFVQVGITKKSILTLREKKGITRNVKNFIILAADKGNATTMRYTSHYKQKIHNQLDPSTYWKLSLDHTSRVLRKTNGRIKLWLIPEEKKRLRRTLEVLNPRLYGLLKVQTRQPTTTNRKCSKITNIRHC